MPKILVPPTTRTTTTTAIEPVSHPALLPEPTLDPPVAARPGQTPVTRRIAGALLGVALAFAATSPAMGQPSGQPLGTRPGYLAGGPSTVPNQEAMSPLIWAPGLDEGYVPQGLAYAGSTVLLSAYRSTDPQVGRGPCRVYAVSAITGQTTGQFDLPDSCGHAGGLVMIDERTLVVADTRLLYKIDLARALAAGQAAPALLATVRLAGNLKGSFVDFDGRDLWVASSEKSADKAFAHRLSLAIFEAPATAGPIDDAAALSRIPIPTEGNGMAFDRQGAMWLTASNSRFGTLFRLNPATGEVQARHDMPIGIEDLAFDPQGGLWSVSEAGSRRWLAWRQSFPLIFRIDLSKLK